MHSTKQVVILKGLRSNIGHNHASRLSLAASCNHFKIQLSIQNVNEPGFLNCVGNYSFAFPTSLLEINRSRKDRSERKEKTRMMQNCNSMM